MFRRELTRQLKSGQGDIKSYLNETLFSYRPYESFMKGGTRVKMRDVMEWLFFYRKALLLEVDGLKIYAFTYEDILVAFACIREIRELNSIPVWGDFNKERGLWHLGLLQFQDVCKSLKITVSFVSY